MPENQDEVLYKIVRSYAPHLDKDDEVVATGYTLDEARAHCSRPDTREPGQWFDGYDED
jgi:hypothetical protein